MVGTEPPPNVVPVPRWTLAIHLVQFVFAIIILGLDAYGIRWIAYNALIYSLVVCLCTMAVAIYLVVSQLFVHKIYNAFVALGLHVWMLLFWVVDLGLVANLARMWGNGDRCYYSFSYDGYYCFYKRDMGAVMKRDETTTYGAYWGALTAGSIFAAVELVTFALTCVILIIHYNKHRNNTLNPTTTAPPQYNPGVNSQAVPMEKFNHNQSVAPTPQPHYASPVQQPQRQQQHPYGVPYAQDPVPRQDTVSPVSQTGHVPPTPNVPELHSPQHTGQQSAFSTHNRQEPYNHNVSELSTQERSDYNYNVSELSSQR